MRVNDVVGVAGFALPGNYVDVVVNTVEDSSSGGKPVSKIVLEKILVLAVAQETGRDDTKPAARSQCGHARGDTTGGGTDRLGSQRRLTLAGAAQPDRLRGGEDRRGNQGDAARARPSGASGSVAR